MGILDKEKTSNLTLKSPTEVFTELLKIVSGANYSRTTGYDIFYQIIAFKGIIDGIGTSTIVANTAIALAKLGLTVCVIDSSVLNPVQDVLLKTNWRDKDIKKRKDWFDIMYTDASVLHESKINKNISVLSFKGKKRDITDIMGTQDSEILVETALSILHSKFDLILIDCCQETTQIMAGCLHQAQKVIQVWSDTPHIISNIDMWITNQVIMSCPLDKMRYVIISKFVSDIHCDFTEMLKQYRFIQLASCGLSIDIARVNATGKILWEFPSSSPDITEFNKCIIDIVCHILAIDKDYESKGTITTDDILDGKVEGTLHKKMKNAPKDTPDIITTLEEADASLEDDNYSYKNGRKTSKLNAYEIDSNENTLVEDYMKEYSENADMEYSIDDDDYSDDDTSEKKGLFSKLFGGKKQKSIDDDYEEDEYQDEDEDEDEDDIADSDTSISNKKRSLFKRNKNNVDEEEEEEYTTYEYTDDEDELEESTNKKSSLHKRNKKRIDYEDDEDFEEPIKKGKRKKLLNNSNISDKNLSSSNYVNEDDKEEQLSRKNKNKNKKFGKRSGSKTDIDDLVVEKKEEVVDIDDEFLPDDDLKHGYFKRKE